MRAGTWSTAALSQPRYNLAATSLPDAGVAIFAGGYCTSCDGLFGVLRDGYGLMVNLLHIQIGNQANQIMLITKIMHILMDLVQNGMILKPLHK